MEREVKVPKIRGTKVFQREWKGDGGGVNRKGTKVGGKGGLAKGGDIIFGGGRPTSKYSPRARTCHSTPLLPSQGRNIFHQGGMVERGGFRADRNLKSVRQREAVVSLITAGLKNKLELEPG